MGIEGVADRDVQVGDGGGDLGREAVALEQADAVLAGDRAAEREAAAMMSSKAACARRGRRRRPAA